MSILKIRNSVFTPQTINADALNTIFSIENKLYDLNGIGEKIEKIAAFKTEDTPFSLAKDTLTQDDFNQIIDFFKAIDFINDMEFEQIHEQDDALEGFKRYIKKQEITTIEYRMKRLAFAGIAFDNFDFKDKTGEEATDYFASHGDIEYDVADIEQRNECIAAVCSNLIADLKIVKDTEIYEFLVNDALLDISNSMFRIPFWVTPNAIIAFKSYYSV